MVIALIPKCQYKVNSRDRKSGDGRSLLHLAIPRMSVILAGIYTFLPIRSTLGPTFSKQESRLCSLSTTCYASDVDPASGFVVRCSTTDINPFLTPSTDIDVIVASYTISKTTWPYRFREIADPWIAVVSLQTPIRCVTIIVASDSISQGAFWLSGQRLAVFRHT